MEKDSYISDSSTVVQDTGKETPVREPRYFPSSDTSVDRGSGRDINCKEFSLYFSSLVGSGLPEHTVSAAEPPNLIREIRVIRG